MSDENTDRPRTRGRARARNDTKGPVVLVSHTYGSTNPYLLRLTEELEKTGATTESFTGRQLRRGQVDVWHLHWPEGISRFPPPRRALLAFLRLCVNLVVARWRRVAVVWTVHNVKAHDTPRPHVDTLVRTVLAFGLTGWIALSDEAATEARAQMPRLRRRPCWVIPHGDYREAYPPAPSRSAARRELHLPDDAAVLLFFGLIRPYKNVPALMEAFRDVEGDSWRLVIAGSVFDDEEDEDRLRSLAARDERVVLRLGYVEDEQVPVLFGASDLAVLPFRDTLNSGSAILSLSFDRPVLVPDLGSMRSLERQVGHPWVQLFDGPIRGPDLEKAAAAAAGAVPPAPLDALSWTHIGERTVAAYRALMGRVSGDDGHRVLRS